MDTKFQPHPDSKRRRLLIVFGVAGLLLLALLAGVLVRYLTRGHVSNQTARSGLPVVVDDVQNLRFQGNDKEASKQIEASLKNDALTTDQRHQLYVQQGSIHADAGQWQPAADSFKKAMDVKETYDVAMLLGDAYKQAGDKTQAITYYRKAIDLMPSTNPVADDDKRTLEQHIKTLEEQP